MAGLLLVDTVFDKYVPLFDIPSLLRLVQQASLPLNLDIFKRTIAACVRNKDAVKALGLVVEMRERGIIPDLEVYETITGGFTQQGEPDVVLA
ncbi:hypothetical protein NGA_0681100, partial [Nannochloropsis gaditana CCMP526]|uniref:uncharacterized protein n=1 Tax=Nannochloropsis gaditana (strain CCMP526) TaxID=1093141 RepID=UPI00029F727B